MTQVFTPPELGGSEQLSSSFVPPDRELHSGRNYIFKQDGNNDLL